MADTGLGTALRVLRDRRTFSIREVGKLAEIDHAYIHRLETGEKTNPSSDLIDKLLVVLKANGRDAAIVRWLSDHPESAPSTVEYVLNTPDVEFDVFTVAAGARHRGNVRPEPAELIRRVRRALSADDDE